MSHENATPWYYHPIMWLVLAPPLGAVLGGIVTLVLIVEHPDPVLETAHTVAPILNANARNAVIPPNE